MGRSDSVKKIAKRAILEEKREKRIIYFFVVFTITSFSLLFLFLVSSFSFTGLASYIDSKAGSVTEVEISVDAATAYWTGVYGLVFRVPSFITQISNVYDSGEVVRQDLFFKCIQSGAIGGNEVYAASVPALNFNLLRAATVADVDDFMECSGSGDCASDTFSKMGSVNIGGRIIDNVPVFETHRIDNDENRTLFDLGVLTDGTNLVYFTHIEDIETIYNETSYKKNSEIVNFQMMLPTKRGESQRYYFFTDPTDVCPDDEIEKIVYGTLEGKVFDKNNNPISSANVILAGKTVQTSTDGSFTLSVFVLPGNYNLFVQKDGYKSYFSNVTFNFDTFYVYRNIYLEDEVDGQGEVFEANVYGLITGAAGEKISGASVYLGNQIAKSTTSGNYNLTANLNEGVYTLVFVKEGYHNKNVFVEINDSSPVEVDVVMIPLDNFQYETGPYDEEVDPGEIIEEVIASGEDFWVSTKEINKELRRNTFVEETIGIYNSRKTGMNLNYQLSENLEGFIKLDKVRDSISPETFSELKVTIYGTPDVGFYSGTLKISGDLEQEILINVKIIDQSYSVEILLMETSVFGDVVRPGDNLKYKLNLQNLLRDQSYEVDIISSVKDFRDSTVYYEDEFTTEIDMSKSFIREIPIPDNFSEGDYVLEVRAKYLNFYSVSSSAFLVSRPIYLYSFFGMPLWLIFSIISFLSFAFLNFFMYKRYQDKKKRYRISLEYSTLPNPESERVVRMGLIAESKHPAYYEIDKLTTHAIVAGATGMGKSISAQVLIEECLLKGISVIVFDPTAQWSGMLRKCTDKKMTDLYSKFGLKPKDAQAFKGNVKMIKDSRQKIDINKYVNPGQIQIFSMNKLTPAEIDVFVSNVIKQIFRSDPKEAPQLKTLLVFDEVHRLLPKFGGSGAGFLQIERACREFRKWGLGVMLISQVLNDFVGEIKANINTELQARTLEEGDLERIRTKYGEEFLKSLVKAEVGVIMFQNADYNRGRPYFVNFRPILHSTRRLSDEELEKYNMYNDKVDNVEFQIQKLEEEKVDVFDLKMELKLIKDKIMTGSFSVVEIYLEGLLPRVQKEWEKLGKSAPEMKIELVDEKDMAEEEKKSSEEKKEVVEKEKLDEQKEEAEKEDSGQKEESSPQENTQ